MSRLSEPGTGPMLLSIQDLKVGFRMGQGVVA
jgi:hypothetical protein